MRQRLLVEWPSFGNHGAVHVVVALIGLTIWTLPLVTNSTPINPGDRADDQPTMAVEDNANRTATPRYMIDLYQKFASDRYSTPIANIIRSFTAATEGTYGPVFENKCISVL